MSCCSRVRVSSVGTDEGWEHWLFKDLNGNTHLTNITFRRANLIFEEFNTYLLDASKANKLEEVILKQPRKDIEEKLMKARRGPPAPHLACLLEAAALPLRSHPSRRDPRFGSQTGKKLAVLGEGDGVTTNLPEILAILAPVDGDAFPVDSRA